MGGQRPDWVPGEGHRLTLGEVLQPAVEEVDHPAHYGGDTTYEVIKVLRAWLTPEEYVGFLKGNVIKYEARARKKGGLRDYEKAKWYQDELVRFEKDRATAAPTISANQLPGGAT